MMIQPVISWDSRSIPGSAEGQFICLCLIGMILKICIQAAHVKQIYMLPKSNNFSKCYLICVIINWTVNMPVFCVSEFPSTFVNTIVFARCKFPLYNT